MPMVYRSGKARQNVPHAPTVLADRVELPPDILARGLHSRQQVADDSVFKVLIQHRLGAETSIMTEGSGARQRPGIGQAAPRDG